MFRILKSLFVYSYTETHFSHIYICPVTNKVLSRRNVNDFSSPCIHCGDGGVFKHPRKIIGKISVTTFMYVFPLRKYLKILEGRTYDIKNQKWID